MQIYLKTLEIYANIFENATYYVIILANIFENVTNYANIYENVRNLCKYI